MLDAGGGTGRWARAFAKHNFRVDVLDQAEQMIEVGKEKVKSEQLENVIRFFHGNISELPFDDESYDVVISQGNPICYCENPYKAISEIARVAKPEGRIILSVHNRLAMIQYFCFLMGAISVEEAVELSSSGHVHIDYPRYGFLPDELERVVVENGLTVVSLIGKPVISGFAQTDSYKKLLADKKIFEKIVEIEREHWDNPYLLGMAGHLEICCVKPR